MAVLFLIASLGLTRNVFLWARLNEINEDFWNLLIAVLVMKYIFSFLSLIVQRTGA